MQLKLQVKEVHRGSPGGVTTGGGGGESAELLGAKAQWDDTRTAPGIVAPGAYSAAFAQSPVPAVTGGAGTNVTRVPYDSDDPRYRDNNSTPAAAPGVVTGRITGLADGQPATSTPARPTAACGAPRPAAATGSRSPTSCRRCPRATCTSTPHGRAVVRHRRGEHGRDQLRRQRRLRAARPAAASSRRRPGRRHRAREHDDPHLRFSGDTVWAATSRGVWSHSASGSSATPWKLLFAPNPTTCPAAPLAGAPNAAYKNIVNDVAIDPKNAKPRRSRRRLAQRRRVQRLLRHRRRRDLGEDQPERRDQRRRTSAT